MKIGAPVSILLMGVIADSDGPCQTARRSTVTPYTAKPPRHFRFWRGSARKNPAWLYGQVNYVLNDGRMTMSGKPGRRAFMRITGGMTALSWLSREARADDEISTRQPDLLLIMPDQMRGDCLSVLGHDAVRTPSLDALARQGVLFRRAYTTVPSCIPARYALLTGLCPQTSGVVGFKAKPITTPTLPGLLGDHGYTTALVGRYMHQLPESGRCGYAREILGSTHVDDDDYDTFLKRTAPETGGIRQLVKDTGVTYNQWQAAPWPLDNALHPTAWIVEKARGVVADTAPDQPLFLTASFYAPHPPLFPPKALFEEKLGETMPDPAKGSWVDWASLTPEGDRQGHRVLLQGETLHRAQAGYYGLIEQLDTEVGKLIADFVGRSERAGRPWVIVVTADHGEMMGDHGYFRKCQPFEGSANIPLVVAGSPSLGFRAGLRVKSPACLEDIMPTLLRLAGVPIPEAVGGVDLVPCMRGERERTRPWLHFEHAPCYSQAQAFHALTDGRFKYVWRPHAGTEQLFDLDGDPHEETDLGTEPAWHEELGRWRTRLVKRLAARPEGFVSEGKLVAGRPYAALNKGTLTG